MLSLLTGFAYLFLVLVVVCVIVFCSAGLSPFSGDDAVITKAFKGFQQNYLLVFLIMMGSDWLQGPYVYALYEYYGFGQAQIGQLFIIGFSSSMVFGTFIGGIADKFGRKKLAVVFGLCYSAACLTKLVNNFYWLLVGRLLSGVATSLLFSVFEAWMVYEHNHRGFASSALSQTFSLGTFGNGIVAILSGLLASAAASRFGFVSPFMISLGFLVVGTSIVAFTWTENYGDSRIEVLQGFRNAFATLQSDRKVPVLGCVQSLFEASMYTFVFMWTPVLAHSFAPLSEDTLPFGLIFACYMVCVMVGSNIFSVLISRGHTPERIQRGLLAVAAACLSVPFFTSDAFYVMSSFLLFEVCCGCYFPCMGTLRGKYIAEETRAAVMNFFRVPMNLLVVVVLIKVDAIDNSVIFGVCSVWLSMAFALQHYFVSITKAPPNAAGISSGAVESGETE